MRRPPAVALALEEFLSVPHARTIPEVTKQTSLRRRRFVRLFSEEVELTPKLFCRVRRFQEVLRLVGSGQRFE